MIEEITRKAISQNKRVYILIHNGLECGHVCSAKAVEKYLLNKGVSVLCIFSDEYEFAINENNIANQNAIVVLMDEFDTEFFKEYLLRVSNLDDIYVIDSNKKTDQHEYIEDVLKIRCDNILRNSDVCSICQIILEELEESEITPEIASILAKGIMEDTFNLKFIKQGVFSSIAKLIKCGAKYNEILKQNTTKYYLGDEVGIAKVFLKTGTFEVGDTFGTIIILSELELEALKRDYGIWFPQKQIFKMNNLKGCSFNCIIAEDASGEIRMEYRSSKVYGNLDVAKLAKLYGGDGEHNAAHCFISKNKLRNQSDFFASLKQEVINLYTNEASYTKLSEIDLELKSIFESTKRLKKNVTVDKLKRIDELIGQGANYNYLFESFKSYGRFMVENELLSRIPKSIFSKSNPDVSISLSEKSVEMLTKKYNINEDDILKAIYRFSNINVKSVKIILPNGKTSVMDNEGKVVFYGIMNNERYEDIKDINAIY